MTIPRESEKKKRKALLAREECVSYLRFHVLVQWKVQGNMFALRLYQTDYFTVNVGKASVTQCAFSHPTSSLVLKFYFQHTCFT